MKYEWKCECISVCENAAEEMTEGLKEKVSANCCITPYVRFHSYEDKEQTDLKIRWKKVKNRTGAINTQIRKRREL